jgi:hypothetical protein
MDSNSDSDAKQSSPAEPTASTGSARSVWRKAVFAVVLLFILAALVEGGLRVAYRISRGSWNFAGTLDAAERLYIPHPYNAYSLAPNVTIETHVGTLHTNQWGNRGPEQSYEKPPGVVRIVTLGGSTTFCPYASEDAKTWPAQLERILNERCAPLRIEVVNYAAAGYNSADSLTTFALRALDRAPDIVIVHHAWNDLGVGVSPGLVSDYTHRRKVASHRPKGWWYKLAIYRTYIVYKGRVLDKVLGRKPPVGTAEDIDPRAIEIFERNVDSIVLLAQPRGIEPVLLTFASRQPADDDPDWRSKLEHVEALPRQDVFTPAGVFRAIKAYNEAMRRIAARRHVVVVDLANTYPREERYFLEHDFAHRTDAGLEVFARMVAEALIREGVIERAAARQQAAGRR